MRVLLATSSTPWSQQQLSLSALLRSPAEGNYSEGFIQSKLTQVEECCCATRLRHASLQAAHTLRDQDYGIECPTTSTVFSLKTGEIKVWCASGALPPPPTGRRSDMFSILPRHMPDLHMPADKWLATTGIPGIQCCESSPRRIPAASCQSTQSG